MMARLRNLSLVIKVPLIVALLMLVVGIVVSTQVLSRLAETQIRNLEDLTSAYLDGLSSSLLPHVQRDDNWEVFDTLERSRTLYHSLKVQTALVARPDATIVASTDPMKFETETRVPDAVAQSGASSSALSENAIANHTGAWLRRDLVSQGRPLGTIYAEIETGHLLSTRREVLATLVATNLFLTGALMALGWWLVRRMMQPMQALTLRLELGISGNLPHFSPKEIGDPDSEFGRLFSRYNAMAVAISEREALVKQLAEEERLASLGRLSSVIAHEINNPLGGLLNTVDTLKRHGDAASIRKVSVGILERGLDSIRQVVETTLAIYRPDRNPRPLHPHDIADLRLLVDGVAARSEVSLRWINKLETGSPLPNGPIRQIILNLAINAVHATPPGGEVSIEVCDAEDGIGIAVCDEGPGMPDNAVLTLTTDSPARTPRAQEGIGLWMVNRLVHELNAHLTIENREGGGTCIFVRLPHGRLGPDPKEDRDVA